MGTIVGKNRTGEWKIEKKSSGTQQKHHSVSGRENPNLPSIGQYKGNKEGPKEKKTIGNEGINWSDWCPYLSRDPLLAGFLELGPPSQRGQGLDKFIKREENGKERRRAKRGRGGKKRWRTVNTQRRGFMVVPEHSKNRKERRRTPDLHQKNWNERKGAKRKSPNNQGATIQDRERVRFNTSDDISLNLEKQPKIRRKKIRTGEAREEKGIQSLSPPGG